MSTARVDLRGFRAMEKRLRRKLRASGIAMNRASQIALHEMRCRSRMADRIGRPAAKAVELIACQGDYYDDPRFLLKTKLPAGDVEALAGTPGLMLWVGHFPFSTFPLSSRK